MVAMDLVSNVVYAVKLKQCTKKYWN